MKGSQIRLLKTKLLPFSLIAILSLITYSGCKKDPCENIYCEQGYCNEGKCICASGYEGEFCEIKIDPCEGISCLNGGTCEEGACHCPEGFIGDRCDQLVTPKGFRIKKIQIKDWDLYRVYIGEYYDTGGVPYKYSDLYFRFYRQGAEIGKTNVIQNCIPYTDYTLTDGDLPLSLLGNQQTFTIRLYDWDYGSNGNGDLLGTRSFTIKNFYSASIGFPEVIEIGSSQVNDFKAELHVKWLF